MTRYNPDYVPPYLARMQSVCSVPVVLHHRLWTLIRECQSECEGLARHVGQIQRDCQHPEIKHHGRKVAEDDTWDQCMVCGLIADKLDNEEMRQATRRRALAEKQAELREQIAALEAELREHISESEKEN